MSVATARSTQPAPAGWITLLAATATISAANGVVFPLLSDLQDAYHFSGSGLGLIAGTGLAVGFLSQLLLAPLADRGHSQRLLMIGMILAVVGNVSFACASSLPLLVLARCIVGVSNGMFLPAARAIAASISPDRVAERLGRLGGIELAGFVAGPVVGGLLVGPLGIRWPFAICGIAAAVGAIALAGRTLPEPVRSTERHRVSFDLLRLRSIRVGVLCSVALFFPVGLYDAILDRYLTDRGASNAVIGLAFVLYGIPFALLSTIGGRMADRRGAFRQSMLAIMVVAPLTASYGAFSTLPLIFALFIVEGATQALGVPAAQAVVAEAAPLGRASAAQGLAGALNLAAAAIPAFLAPIVYDRWGGFGTFLCAGVAVAVLGSCAWWMHRASIDDAVPQPIG